MLKKSQRLTLQDAPIIYIYEPECHWALLVVSSTSKQLHLDFQPPTVATC